MITDYYVRSQNAHPSSAKVFKGQDVVATILIKEGGNALLLSKDGNSWKMSHRVDGEIRPFSMQVEVIGNQDAGSGEIALKIRDHLFSHGDRMYMLSNVPEGRPQHHAMKGPKVISRLDNFPFKDPSLVDPETRHRLRRFRGVPVGEISGLGNNGHLIRIESELDDIGLPLSASAFLLYTTAIVGASKVAN